jgi:hypothetical protein
MHFAFQVDLSWVLVHDPEADPKADACPCNSMHWAGRGSEPLSGSRNVFPGQDTIALLPYFKPRLASATLWACALRFCSTVRISV